MPLTGITTSPAPWNEPPKLTRTLTLDAHETPFTFPNPFTPPSAPPAAEAPSELGHCRTHRVQTNSSLRIFCCSFTSSASSRPDGSGRTAARAMSSASPPKKKQRAPRKRAAPSSEPSVPQTPRRERVARRHDCALAFRGALLGVVDEREIDEPFARQEARLLCLSK